MTEFDSILMKDELISGITMEALMNTFVDETGTRRPIRMVMGLATPEIFYRLSIHFVSSYVYKIITLAQQHSKFLTPDRALMLMYNERTLSWCIIGDARYEGLYDPSDVNQKQETIKNRLARHRFLDGSYIDAYELGLIMSAFSTDNMTDAQSIIYKLAKEVLYLSDLKGEYHEKRVYVEYSAEDSPSGGDQE